MDSNTSDHSARELPLVQWGPTPVNCFDDCGEAGSEIKIRYGVITEGRGAGVDVVEIDNGSLQVTLLPTRGMSIWQVVCDGVPFKWNSPVQGPVHPSLVPVFDPSGLGWLEGFDEFVVRCGLVSNGAPEFDESGKLAYPLHGRVANLPACDLHCKQDSAGFEIAATIVESRLFFNQLALETNIRIEFGSNEILIEDSVTNRSSSEAESQMLYHINVGAPVLGEGARLLAPIVELAGRDSRAVQEIEKWDTYQGPQSGYRESVYFARLNGDIDGSTSVMLQSCDKANGLGVTWDMGVLPWFVIWKNTAAIEDGYVTGLEPATNFPNERSFETSHGRVVKLQPNETVTYRLRLNPLTSQDSVNEFESRIMALKDGAPKIHQTPHSKWSPN